MPRSDYLQFLGLNENPTNSEIHEALQDKRLLLKQQIANNEISQQSYLHQLLNLRIANNILNHQNLDSFKLHNQEIRALRDQAEQQAPSVTVQQPNNTSTNNKASLNLSSVPIPKPGQFYSSINPKNWNFTDSNGNPASLPSQLKNDIAARLYKIESTLYNKMANDTELTTKTIPGLTLTQPVTTNNQGLTSYNFTANGKPLNPAQQTILQNYYNKNFDDAAKSLAKTGDPFTIKMGPVPSPALQQQQQAQPPTDSSKSTAPVPRPFK